MIALNKRNSKHSSVLSLATTIGIFILYLPLFAVADTCDVIAEGSTFNPKDEKYSNCGIFILDPTFRPMLDGRDKNSGIQVLLTNSEKIFHEGPVLFDNALYFTTNRLGETGDFVLGGNPDELFLDQFVDIMKLDLSTNALSNLSETISPKIPMANGMSTTADGKNILALSQGFNTTGGGIYEIDRESLVSTPILNSFYGEPFSSPNDIVTTHDRIIFFNDPPYGFEQGFRAGLPHLGSNVYRYDTNTKRQTILVERLQRPNGIALLDDRKNGNGCKLFLTDTGFQVNHTPRSFEGYGDNSLYIMEDDNDGCFATEDGPWTLEPLVPATGGGIQDGMQVHISSKTLLYCTSEQGMWIFSIPLRRNIGLVNQPCGQLIAPQKDGLQTVYLLHETQLWTVGLNFVSTKKTKTSKSKATKKAKPLRGAA